MTDQDYNHLELLLSKLGLHLGRRFAIIPGYLQDGVHLATYNESGALEDEAVCVDLKAAVEQIKNKQL